jgi:hypothetical protein
MEKVKSSLESKDILKETAIVPFSGKSSDCLTRPSIIKKIINLTPERSSRDSFNKRGEEYGSYLGQVRAFASLIEGIRDGKIMPDNPMSVVGKTDREKVKVATDIISQQLAIYVLTDPKDQSKFSWHWDRRMAELIDFIGIDHAVTIMRTTIEDLPEPVRELFFSVSSTNLTQNLGHIDVYECDEARYVQYLRNATSIPDETKRTDVLGELVSVLEERICEGTINPDGVIERIISSNYSELVFRELMESAKKNGQVDMQDQYSLIIHLHMI